MKLIESTVDDFLHLLHIYDDNETWFESISNNLGRCDSDTCQIFVRNFLDRRIYHLTFSDDAFRFEIMDKIHCFWQHSHHIGNRIYTRSQEKIKFSNSRFSRRDRFSKYNQLGNQFKNGIYDFGVGFKYMDNKINDDDDNKYSVSENECAYLKVYPHYESQN
eukprot:414615_1